MWSRIEPYRSSIVLLLALILGGALGILAPDIASKLQPLGQIFLNLLFMIIVPLVGVSVMSSIASMTDLKRLGRIIAIIFVVSIAMALIPAVGIVALALWYNPAQGVIIDLSQSVQPDSGQMDFVSMITTSDFIGLFSKSNILALIVMAIIAGIAIGQSESAGKRIALLLEDANVVIMKIVAIIMKAAPVGLGCYFAATMASQDAALLLTFARAIGLFMVATFVYFILGSILYSYIGGGVPAVKAFWRYAIEPSATALGTCSSLGTLPVTLRAGKGMGINPEIVDVSIPLLVNLNKGGVAMIAALKIVFIYSVLGLPFTMETFLLTMLIAVLSAIIVGGVPGGAFLGEIFIVTTLGLPMEAIPMLVVLGTITDAPATLINVIHDLNAAQIVERFSGIKRSDDNAIQKVEAV
ncbi:dicarboxylate/amino acid:cation symporter [Pantoea ananatis]|uniref:dicarboxylate/amino acid:cation symporter n=1 Tax=Pantoea ananas TaxID=553 RepID=UPI0007DABF97|nr:dicarboxylate/amino acid:cation symporter [Pantoea ananatis]MCW0351650.1 C4-dicarboxylate transport protein [Pantoea ananatis]USL59472.1 dicarboxylate/amino acid:cation symporter [Pantoea ananatis]UYL01389.1 dicarboxylate/amino acid:cation symporter [Pantoea ananatis]